MIFRPAFPADIDGILRLGKDVAPNIAAHVAAGRVFVAEDFCGIVATVAVIQENGVNYLASMVVSRICRGSGIGRDLVRYVEDCVGTPLFVISLQASEGFWRACGFSPSMRVMEKVA